MWRSLFGFQGRIRRSDWWLSRFWTIGIFLAGLLVSSVFGGPLHGPEAPSAAGRLVGLALFGLTAFTAAWINIAATVRRWHDRGKSGWMTLITVIPLLGPLWLLVECGCLPGTAGPNEYGSPPDGLSGARAAAAAS